MKISFLLAIALFVSNSAIAQPQKLYISPKAALGENQSRFIDSIKFYPLENKQGVSLSKYANIQITDKYFIITDFPGKKLLLYTKNGRYVNTISYKKLGANVYPTFDKNKNQLTFFYANNNYTLTENDQREVKLDFANPRNKKYYKKYFIDLNDSLFRIQKATPTAFDILDAYNIKDDLYAAVYINVDPHYKDSLDYEIKIYKNTEFVKVFYPYNKQKEPKYLYARWSQSPIYTINKPNIFYISRPYVDTVYTLSKDSITAVYKIVLPMENAVPKSYLTTTFKNQTERENFERNNGSFLRQLYMQYDGKKYLSINKSLFQNYFSILYDKKTNAAYNMEKIKPDSLTYQLPIMNGWFGSKDSSKFYKVLSAETLKAAYEQKNQSAPYPPALQACFTDPKKPTPIIVEYTLKEN